MTSILKGSLAGAVLGAAVSSGAHFWKKKNQANSHPKAKLYPHLFSTDSPSLLLPPILKLEQFEVFVPKILESLFKQSNRLSALVICIHDKKQEAKIRYIRNTYMFADRFEQTLKLLFRKILRSTIRN